MEQPHCALDPGNHNGRAAERPPCDARPARREYRRRAGRHVPGRSWTALVPRSVLVAHFDVHRRICLGGGRCGPQRSSSRHPCPTPSLSRLMMALVDDRQEAGVVPAPVRRRRTSRSNVTAHRHERTHSKGLSCPSASAAGRVPTSAASRTLSPCCPSSTSCATWSTRRCVRC